MSTSPEQIQARMAEESRFVAERGGQGWLAAYIEPFYLDWMQDFVANADGFSFQRLDAVRNRALELPASDIAAMLGMQWRLQVMGAWYAIAKRDPSLAGPVHDAFGWCFGHLTSPALAAAALTYQGVETESVLQRYLARTREADYGDESTIKAALHHLRPIHPAERDSADVMTRLLTVAGALRTSAP